LRNGLLVERIHRCMNGTPAVLLCLLRGR
jgi:hypothetical protein